MARRQTPGRAAQGPHLRHVFPYLAKGFLVDRKQRLGQNKEPTEEELANIFEATLTLLYRLLFLLYAESRDLLPIREAPYHAASLKKIKEEIAEKAGAYASLDVRLLLWLTHPAEEWLEGVVTGQGLVAVVQLPLTAGEQVRCHGLGVVPPHFPWHAPEEREGFDQTVQDRLGAFVG
jgi:hypothetical protein